jgi:hypothetical protein
MTVQQQLMRQASIRTTMNVYGQAMADTKREENRKIVQMVLGESKKTAGTGWFRMHSVNKGFWGFAGQPPIM